MRNGLFCDIAELYDADDALGKDGLNAAVMDAGVVDGARYVLPLRYDIPVIYALNAYLEAEGLDPAVLTRNLDAILEAVLETGDPLLAGGVLYEDLSAFSGFIDYRSGNATLDTKTLRDYMAAYQALKAVLGREFLDRERLDDSSLPPEGKLLLEKLDIR